MYHRGLRDMSAVKRWGLLPLHNQQSIADHSFYVVVYVEGLCRELRLSVADTLLAVQYAIWHDAPEQWSTDIPGPVKREVVDRARLTQFEDRMFKEGVGVDRVYEHEPMSVGGNNRYFVTPKMLVKVADLMDEVFYLAYERTLGNQHVVLSQNNAMERLRMAWATLFKAAGKPEQMDGGSLWAVAVEFPLNQIHGGVVPPRNNSDVQS